MSRCNRLEVAVAEKLSYGINEVVEAVGLSRPTIYRLIQRGELRTFKIGTRTLILRSALEEFLTRQAAG